MMSISWASIKASEIIRVNKPQSNCRIICESLLNLKLLILIVSAFLSLIRNQSCFFPLLACSFPLISVCLFVNCNFIQYLVAVFHLFCNPILLFTIELPVQALTLSFVTFVIPAQVQMVLVYPRTAKTLTSGNTHRHSRRKTHVFIYLLVDDKQYAWICCIRYPSNAIQQ